MIPSHTLAEQPHPHILDANKDVIKHIAVTEMDGTVVEVDICEAPVHRNIFYRTLIWYATWAIPGLGMFSEAYIIFSSGQIGTLQKTLHPTCYKTWIDCDKQMVLHVAGYIQICGIMAGMLVWGALGDVVGRKWGSSIVATIMLSGVIMLIFTPFAPGAYAYFVYFMVSQTWYGFGVGGEYPMAASSAAELSEVNPALFALRGRQVILVFSNQGMGNFVNACVLAISMKIFKQTGNASILKNVTKVVKGIVTHTPKIPYTQAHLDMVNKNHLTPIGCRNVLALMYGFGAFSCLVMVLYRWIFLKESEMYKTSRAANQAMMNSAGDRKLRWTRYFVQVKWYSPRLFVASAAWIANDFAFYGNKLFQNTFITILYPTATPYKKQQWNILNSFVALTGYYMAAWLVDKPWYGRQRMQTVGFMWMFLLYVICGAMFHQLTTSGPGALHCFQFMYYFSSFWNQFGPNATTWLVAGEMFPTDVRSSFHGFNACMGKLGAIISALWFSYVSNRVIFLLSAAFGIAGALVTIIFLADTTGLNLHEYDRMNQCILLGRFDEYHGEAVNPKHLSLFERWVLKWHSNYNPELDAQQREQELNLKK